ncbi:hypothetical protein HO133_009485 [Letharia lupina]|uniref:Nonsense-mediated mRNA decay factor n=1 Tax=Letharia lupina TaxID=560253 RepID=A0A8H6FEJ4_9LECA|nr:uncharacterized protein HO133_009485 [Letharia lupina]KAF6225485.1 hypothetical protein HO133_009485 [Letharia lupina]
MGQPSDLNAKIQSHRRSAAGGYGDGYTCPICERRFQAWPKAWNHAKEAHQDFIEDIGSIEEVEAKKRFQATKEQKQPNPSEVAISPAQSKPSSVGNRITPTIEGELRPYPSNRPNSAPGDGHGDGKRIDDFGHLTIGQRRATGTHDRLGYDKPVLENNPRKRGAEGESGSPVLQPLAAQRPISMLARARHAKSGSRGFSIGKEESDLNRQQATENDPEFKRGAPGSIKPLWDPNIDDPNTRKAARRDRQPGHVNKPPRRPHPSREPRSRPKKPDIVDEQPNVADTREQTMSTEPHVTHFDSSRKTRILAKKEPPPSDGDSPPGDEPSEGSEAEPEMLLQPDTRPISHEQLVVEVKGIYAGLVMVEAKCIDIDERQSAAAQEKDPSKKIDLKNDQWQSLIALHKQLLHEHHDFFLASQHPSASAALSRLAAKYSMPARMWRHGIHAFLEVLRHRLPQSLEHMLAFIYIAYSMMALLYETVSTFEDTWIECLGDLGRYRMAIEDDEPKDREVWSNVARFWYNKAADKSPNVGRLYHHLAILARPYTLEQLSLYTRSLTCVTPFESAKGSIMTLFNPILNGKESATRRSSFETIFIRAHGILFTKGPADPSDRFDKAIMELEADDLLENYITKTAARFKEAGVFAAVANIAALFEYGIAKHGVPKPILRLAFEASENANQVKDEQFGTSDFDAFMSCSPGPSVEVVTLASKIAFGTLSISLRRPEDPNVHPLVHVYLVFLRTFVGVEQAMKCIEPSVPWNGLCSFLNFLSTPSRAADPSFRSKDFPEPEEGPGRPLPEDFVMRGQLYSQWYFPEAWFTDAMIDDDERTLDLPSMAKPRADRLFWLGHSIASAKKWIRFDEVGRRFSPTAYANEICECSTAETLSDQIEIESQTEAGSNDEDSTMEDAGTVPKTPGTMSLALSDSQAASEESTRASTPTENRTEDVPAFERDDVADDVTMKDLGPEKAILAGTADEFRNPKAASLPSSTVIHPSSPPWKAGKTKQEPVDYASDPQKLEELLRLNEPDSSDLYKP